jgi:ATP-dependent protease ClpP protease subunit
MDKYIVAQDKNTGVARMRLFNTIDSDGIILDRFNDEFDWLLSQPDVKEIEILINSKGGSVFDGLPIYNSIANSPKPVTTIVDSIAASMGAIIALGGSTRKMYEHGQIMIHSAYVPNYPESGSDPAVKNINDTLFNIVKKITKKAKAVVQDWLSKDTWFNAHEALQAGLIDEIIPTTINAKYLSAYRNDVQLIIAQTTGDLNNLKLKYENFKMIEIINELKLDDQATEKDIIAKIKEVQTQITDFENQLAIKNAELQNRDSVISELTIKVTAFEQTERDKIVNEINALIEQAFNEKKINAQGKDIWKAILSTDFENGKKALSGLAKPEKISESISTEGDAVKQPQMMISDIQKLNQQIF